MSTAQVFWTCLVFVTVFLRDTGAVDERIFGQEIAAPSREVLIQKVQERERRVRTAVIEWTQERSVAARTLLVRVEVDGRQETKLWPETDETYESKHKFSFDRNRTRHWQSENTRDKGITTTESLSTYDGMQVRTLDSPSPSFRFPSGRIYPDGTANRQLAMAETGPVLDCYCLINESLNLTDHQIFKLEEVDPQIDGVTHIVASLPANKLIRVFWFDPNRDYVVVRSTLQRGAIISMKTDFTYRRGSDLPWVLSGWTINSYREGKVHQTHTAKVTNRSKYNPRLEDSEFTIEFPVDTHVDDLRNRTK